MQYPLISEYVSAIQDASDNLDELAHLVPVLDDHGEPYRSSGAFAVVFKMKDEQTGKCYALKCFTEEQEGRAEAYRQIADELELVDSSYITSVKYLEKKSSLIAVVKKTSFLFFSWIGLMEKPWKVTLPKTIRTIMLWLCFVTASVRWQHGFALSLLLMVILSQTTSWFVLMEI